MWEANEEEDAEFIFCLETFMDSDSNEKQLCCMLCLKWVHEDCAGVDPLIYDDFMCNFSSS